MCITIVVSYIASYENENELQHLPTFAFTYTHKHHQKLVYKQFYKTFEYQTLNLPIYYLWFSRTYTQPHQQLNWIENWLLLWALEGLL